MAVFYVLPPRPLFGECLAQMLRPYVPGISIDNEACADLVDSLIADAPGSEETYLVHREDLPEGEELSSALREGYGAEAGDQIIHVSIGPKPDEPRVRVWKLDAA